MKTHAFRNQNHEKGHDIGGGLKLISLNRPTKYDAFHAISCSLTAYQCQFVSPASVGHKVNSFLTLLITKHTSPLYSQFIEMFPQQMTHTLGKLDPHLSHQTNIEAVTCSKMQYFKHML